ncbi:BppU family phage baseplate upper protein [Lactobacillus sp. ESL0677]|uniref:BppU family phage baseplate upper protein n=1 Tax=Lactobacillus sp. ESL0677 TaxID=2983208 RepID=UPI0023F7FCF1|nr:BppU family phage baseplate upper protein [Lactobacillus sp. ESL0677]WEV36208.1 hypothetical protein OZX76_05530 [Lactobacillus sp. ESL0677]
MSIPKLTLNTDKNNSDINDDVVIRQSEKGLVILAKIIDANGNAYDLINFKLAFAENKNGNRMVDDSNVQVVDPTYGEISYKLRPEVYQETGEAWFEIESNNGLIDTTNNFHIEVIKQADLNVSNDNYWSSAADMLTHMQASLDKAQQELAKFVSDENNTINSSITSNTNKLNQLVNTFNQKITAYQNQLSQYDAKYKALDSNWQAEIDKLDSSMQATVNATNQQAKTDFANQKNQFQTDFTAFEANLKADLTSQLSAINQQIKTLVNTTMPDLNAKADAVQKKVDSLKADFNKIDFTSFVKSLNGKKPDGDGNVQVPLFAPNLLEGTNDELQDIGGNGLLSNTKVPIISGGKVTAKVWIDNTSNSDSDCISLWAYNGDSALYVVKGNDIASGQKGWSTIVSTITNANVTSVTAHISGTATKVKMAKLSIWQDIGTPPDMTWLPHVDDSKNYTDTQMGKIPKPDMSNYYDKATVDKNIATAKSDAETYAYDQASINDKNIKKAQSTADNAASSANKAQAAADSANSQATANKQSISNVQGEIDEIKTAGWKFVDMSQADVDALIAGKGLDSHTIYHTPD